MGKVKTKARVVRVIDGDTFQALVTVRMAAIDAPETKGIERPLGLIAKGWLAEHIEGKDVELEIAGNDIYKRLLAEVYESDTDINEQMLEEKIVEKYSPKNHNNGKLDI